MSLTGGSQPAASTSSAAGSGQRRRKRLQPSSKNLFFFDVSVDEQSGVIKLWETGDCNYKLLLHEFFWRSAVFRPFRGGFSPSESRSAPIGCRRRRVTAHLHKVEPFSTFEAHDAHEAHEAHNAGRSSTPAYIENEWQLAAHDAHDAFGVSPR